MLFWYHLKVVRRLVELAIEKSSTSAEKLFCIVKSYEYRYRAQDMPSLMQRRDRSILTARVTAWNGRQTSAFDFDCRLLF